MDGTLKVEVKMPKYVSPGERYTIKTSGIEAPDGTAVGYYFSSSANNDRKDTLLSSSPTYVYEIPDTLGSFAMSIVAFPIESSDKYYVSLSSFNFTIVKDDPFKGSITNVLPREDESSEELYGRPYYIVNAGGREWIRSNLCRVDRDSDGNRTFGIPYADCVAMQNIFGAYYTWEEAVAACPSGWHLPSDAEWVELLKESGAPAGMQPLESSPAGAGKLMVKGFFNGSEMWSYYRGVNITDASISVLPVGYAMINEDAWEFIGYQEYAVFWTADEYSGQGVYRYIYKENDNVYVGSADKKAFAASVRCVR